jgi:hypothetical protein
MVVLDDDDDDGGGVVVAGVAVPLAFHREDPAPGEKSDLIGGAVVVVVLVVVVSAVELFVVGIFAVEEG